MWIAIWIAIQMMYLFTWDIHCSTQGAPHCCSLFSNCYIKINLIGRASLAQLFKIKLDLYPEQLTLFVNMSVAFKKYISQ